MKRKAADAPTHSTNNSWTRGGKGSKNIKDVVITSKMWGVVIKLFRSPIIMLITLITLFNDEQAYFVMQGS
jgi:hypothetical protein